MSALSDIYSPDVVLAVLAGALVYAVVSALVERLTGRLPRPGARVSVAGIAGVVVDTSSRAVGTDSVLIAWDDAGEVSPEWVAASEVRRAR